MKKKIIGLTLIPILVVIVFCCVISLRYFFTTMSASECEEYCIMNTERNATSFSCFGDGRYIEDYKYYVAADGDSSAPQEIFVFKRKFLGFIELNRYEFVMSSTQSTQSTEGTNKFGSLQFFPRNNSGEKATRATLIFFGANKDSHITEYEYTLSVREGDNVYRGRAVKTDRIWFVKFFELENGDDNTKKVISDVKFYDSKGNFVDSY